MVALEDGNGGQPSGGSGSTEVVVTAQLRARRPAARRARRDLARRVPTRVSAMPAGGLERARARARRTSAAARRAARSPRRPPPRTAARGCRAAAPPRSPPDATGSESRSSSMPHLRRGGEMAGVARETVAQVEHRARAVRGEPETRQRSAARDAAKARRASGSGCVARAAMPRAPPARRRGRRSPRARRPAWRRRGSPAARSRPITVIATLHAGPADRSPPMHRGADRPRPRRRSRPRSP